MRRPPTTPRPACFGVVLFVDRAARLADRRPPARKRGAGAPPGARPREPRAAVAVHRPAPAREHPGGGPQDRIRLINESAAQMLGDENAYPERCWARPRRGCCICWRPGARAAGASGAVPAAEHDLRRRRRRARDPAALRAAGNARPAGAGLPGGHEPDRREGAAVEARGPRAA